jgi:predicted dehydrogenase
MIKIGIIGGGLNSAVGSAHFSALLLSNKYKIIAGSFSRNREINLQTGFKYNLDESIIYSNLTELIKNNSKNLDCIIILTPTDQHTSQVIECLDNNIPVICEKALTSSVEDAMIIKNKLIESNGFLSVIYNYLGYPMLRELKYILNSNKLGKIIQIQTEMPQEGFLKIVNGSPLKPQDWRLHDDKISVLSLDLGVHLHMMIKFLISEIPIKVVSSSQSYGNFSEVTDNINSIVQYSNNIICNMWYSKVAIGKRNGLFIRVYGELGSAEWYQENPEYLQIALNDGQRFIVDRGSRDIRISIEERYTRFKVGHPAGFIEALANYYEDIANDLKKYLNGESNFTKESFGVDEALEGLKLFDAIEKSNKNASWQNIL